MKKKISVVTPCYNEEENVVELHQAIDEVFSRLPQYEYEHIYIDNCSQDRTQELIRELAAQHRNVKAIFNARNFGHIRSPYYGLLQGSGDAVILMASDFQDPPSLIPQFLEEWEKGNKVVMAVKNESEESALFFAVRKFYYNLIGRLSDTKLVKNYTGTGLYDRAVIQTLRKIDDPYPYFRGLVADLGYRSARVFFTQPARRRGFSKNNFYTLYDMALLGITNHSKIPLRMATMAGFGLSALSLLVAVVYLLAKLIFWSEFTLGMAPIVIGLFFFSSVQLFFIGILGEYIGSIHTQVLKRPLVIEAERLNFEAQAAQVSERPVT